MSTGTIVPHITAVYAALSAILVMILALRVVAMRRAARVGLGDGGNAALAQRIRVHGNAIENLPLALLLLLLLELTGAPVLLLHGFGALLLGARVLHAWGLSTRPGGSFGRFSGTLVTWLLVLAMAGWLIVGRLLG
ncbi:MAG TPA: MAPEG family protein [Xanthomonadaceae bacterium]|nr:MAPEG family protein [Xanthomonadaceae bacterium]